LLLALGTDVSSVKAFTAISSYHAQDACATALVSANEPNSTVSQEKDARTVKCVNDPDSLFRPGLRSYPQASDVESDSWRCPQVRIAYDAFLFVNDLQFLRGDCD
jgi:hypothetical protein